ncbi:AAA family ATPase [uncultured Megasphaera sp.]|uniref:AAA family ATPase n=1 Tax=uncultured Megasphaera sp. TaxID=165188 RepID=UPI00263525E9|nr:AAA family ATPase [uncultured Megasphaera sp.]
MHWEMPIGIDNFGELRRGHYYFVDKTAFIRKLIDGHSKVTLLTRPRRFGKTLTLSMADWFFSIEKETQSRHLFEGLAIEQAGPEYMEHRGRYPVVFLSLKDLKNLTWDAMFDSFRTLIRNWYTAHAYLGESDRFDPDVRTRFLDLKRGQAGAGEMAGSLALLLQMLHGYYGKKVILLVDEYDAPIQQAWKCGFYPSFARRLLPLR